MREEEFVAAAQQGDVHAFNQLVLKHQGLVYNVTYRILRDSERADDATQETFLRGFRALPQFRGGSFKTWILRIATNCSYDQLRARQRRPATSFDDMVGDDEHNALLTDRSEAPESYVERQQLGRLIQEGLDTLPDDQRVAVILSDIQGLSYEEIAESLNIALGTVKSRLSRGRAKMREYLVARKELLPHEFRPRFD
ncbi:MAG TPA: sigma-70 family RNA polymerase sigma factor [Chloroflexi bacterium]|jgi:RNA polymerase sigma factor (sigma-70 family)|nr:sigma-70 family RNA polymerase sigma factor [Chloroflexota bacterium]